MGYSTSYILPIFWNLVRIFEKFFFLQFLYWSTLLSNFIFLLGAQFFILHFSFWLVLVIAFMCLLTAHFFVVHFSSWIHLTWFSLMLVILAAANLLTAHFFVLAVVCLQANFQAKIFSLLFKPRNSYFPI